MRLLINYFRLKFKVSLIYAIPTISNLFGQALQMVLLFFFWTKVYQADQFTLQYVMWSRVIYGFIGGNSVWELAEEFKNGNISVKLTKPIGYFRYTYTAHLAMQMVRVFLVCIPLSITAFAISPISITTIQFALCAISILLSITICYCFDYFISLFCIFTHNTWGISSLRDGLVQILSGAIVPLALFPSRVSKLIYCLPFAYMVDTPVNILQKNAGYDVLTKQLLYCGLMIAIVIIGEKLFMKKLQIQGG